MEDILQRAKMRLLQGWCRRALARTATGHPCHPNHPHAAAWSLHGAVMRAAHELNDHRAFHAAREAVRWELWRRHKRYLMWVDDDPNISAQTIIRVIDEVLSV